MVNIEGTWTFSVPHPKGPPPPHGCGPLVFHGRDRIFHGRDRGGDGDEIAPAEETTAEEFSI